MSIPFLWAICISNRDSWRAPALKKITCWMPAMPTRNTGHASQNAFPLHKSHHTSNCQICLRTSLYTDASCGSPWDVTKGQDEERGECRVWYLRCPENAHRSELSEGRAQPAGPLHCTDLACVQSCWRLNFLPVVPWILPFLLPTGHCYTIRNSPYNIIVLSCTGGSDLPHTNSRNTCKNHLPRHF